MSAPTSCPTDVDLLKRLLLDMAQQRSVDNVLKLIVDRMAAQPEVALARIWLVGPGDLCANCHMRDQCQDQTSCLHLVASAGSSKQTDEEWNVIGRSGNASSTSLGRNRCVRSENVKL